MILRHIDDHLSDGLSLSELCGIVGLRPSYFKTLFRRSMGMPLHQYVIRQRVDRALRLLSAHAVRLGDVAEETGFTDPSHMARWLRRITGTTPSAVVRDTRLRECRNHPSERSDMEAEAL
jgi:AraC family transcriptional regulator